MDETLKIIEETLDCNERAQRFFPIALEVDKGKSEPTTEESIAKRREKKRKIKKRKDY